jgi:hypothetical protein
MFDYQDSEVSLASKHRKLLKRSNTTDSNNREPYHCYEPVEGGENRT